MSLSFPLRATLQTHAPVQVTVGSDVYELRLETGEAPSHEMIDTWLITMDALRAQYAAIQGADTITTEFAAEYDITKITHQNKSEPVATEVSANILARTKLATKRQIETLRETFRDSRSSNSHSLGGRVEPLASASLRRAESLPLSSDSSLAQQSPSPSAAPADPNTGTTVIGGERFHSDPTSKLSFEEQQLRDLFSDSLKPSQQPAHTNTLASKPQPQAAPNSKAEADKNFQRVVDIVKRKDANTTLTTVNALRLKLKTKLLTLAEDRRPVIAKVIRDNDSGAKNAPITDDKLIQQYADHIYKEDGQIPDQALIALILHSDLNMQLPIQPSDLTQPASGVPQSTPMAASSAVAANSSVSIVAVKKQGASAPNNALPQPISSSSIAVQQPQAVAISAAVAAPKMNPANFSNLAALIKAKDKNTLYGTEQDLRDRLSSLLKFTINDTQLNNIIRRHHPEFVPTTTDFFLASDYGDHIKSGDIRDAALFALVMHFQKDLKLPFQQLAVAEQNGDGSMTLDVYPNRHFDPTQSFCYLVYQAGQYKEFVEDENLIRRLYLKSRLDSITDDTSAQKIILELLGDERISEMTSGIARWLLEHLNKTDQAKCEAFMKDRDSTTTFNHLRTYLQTDEGLQWFKNLLRSESKETHMNKILSHHDQAKKSAKKRAQKSSNT